MIPVALLLGLTLAALAYVLFARRSSPTPAPPPPEKAIPLTNKKRRTSKRPPPPRAKASPAPPKRAPSSPKPPPKDKRAAAASSTSKVPAQDAKPSPAIAKPVVPVRALPRLGGDDDDDDITIVTLRPPLDDDDGSDDSTLRLEGGTIPILYDDEAAYDEPTHPGALILVSAAAQTDRGKKRRKNEDSFLVLDAESLYVVADGMGGHAGGEIASRLAVDVIGEAFRTSTFVGKPSAEIPRRGAEVAMAVQMANHAIWEAATKNRDYEGMGTTIVCARFSPRKQRLYVAHIGDSRCYRLRGDELRQMTTDHTMAAEGLSGPLADRLSRAAGIAPTVKIDLLLARPIPNDVYLVCSDGLTKMLAPEEIRATLLAEPDLDRAARALVEKANAAGGRDNITAILVMVSPAIAS